MHQLTTVPDAELAVRTIERDTHAFEALFERYADALHRHVICILHDETAAHDVVQEAFLRVWTRVEQWRGIGPFKAWLYRTATNLALNQLRSVQRRRECPLEVPAAPDDEDGDHVRREEQDCPVASYPIGLRVRDADNGERRHERDGDRDARKGVGHIGSGQAIRTGSSGCDRCDEVRDRGTGSREARRQL